MRTRRQGIANLVLAEIGERIVRGEPGAGEVLANEWSLMREHGVSRTAVREAVKTLAGKGLLETRPRTGTRVLPRERWNLLDPDVLEWLFAGPQSAASMRHLHEVRCIIEPAAAALAAERATREEIARLGACCAIMDAAGDDVGAFSRADLEFHTVLLRATRNPFVINFATAIEASLLAFFRTTGTDPAAFDSGRPRHRGLYIAISQRDPDAAREAALNVLAGAREVIGRLAKRRQPATKRPKARP